MIPAFASCASLFLLHTSSATRIIRNNGRRRPSGSSPLSNNDFLPLLRSVHLLLPQLAKSRRRYRWCRHRSNPRCRVYSRRGVVGVEEESEEGESVECDCRRSVTAVFLPVLAAPDRHHSQAESLPEPSAPTPPPPTYPPPSSPRSSLTPSLHFRSLLAAYLSRRPSAPPVAARDAEAEPPRYKEDWDEEEKVAGLKRLDEREGSVDAPPVAV
ncbi:hypothetical protein AAT19DRAFT_11020 [Rhodotorula toruloides]|uniref:Uncharacterized protein n=1 Tax=Rhodotorula toruloides TaxID=5286 RepID=A0A2S9ZYQ7_RHOTO|nr:hypothetical protein AAT19DRAFT_11020 [Rhodotorula toruloides]